jgi:hypothetical protein
VVVEKNACGLERRRFIKAWEGARQDLLLLWE